MDLDKALELAKKYANERFGENITTIKEWFDDFGDIYVSHLTTKKFVETRDSQYGTMGLGPLIIDKELEYVYLYGSGTNSEKAIKDYRTKKEKWKKILKMNSNFDLVKNYNVTIYKINDLENLIKLILKLRFTYTKPEVKYGDIWRIPDLYTKEILLNRLKVLPTEFKNIPAIVILDFFELNQNENICEHELAEFISKPKEYDIKRATEEDLATEW